MFILVFNFITNNVASILSQIIAIQKKKKVITNNVAIELRKNKDYIS